MRPSLSAFRPLVTPVLGAAAAGFTVAALLNPLLSTPALASSPLPPTASVAYHSTALSDQHAALMAVASREENAARHLRFVKWRQHRRWKAEMAAAAAKASSGNAVAAATAQPAQPVQQPSGGVLSAAQVERLWVQAGGPASQEGVAACVAWYESGRNPGRVNPNDDYGRQTSWGLFQISNGTHSEPVPGILNAAVNTRQAVLKYDASGWTPWPTAYSCGA